VHGDHPSRVYMTSGPVFGDFIHGRSNGRRRWAMDSLGNTYAKLPNGREKRGGARTRGQRGKL
jgi:hypothetical protein